MANYANLKSDIAGVIRTNNNEEITGDILQEQLLGMVDSLGAGFQYKGVATPTTAPGTPDENVFYIASTAGTYTNFGGLVVADGEVAILKYNGSWAKDVTGAATAAQVTQLGQEVDTKADQSDLNQLGQDIAQTNRSLSKQLQNIIIFNAIQATTIVGLIPNKSSRNFSSSSATGYGIAYIPVVAGKTYHVTHAQKTSYPVYIDVSFTKNVPAAGVDIDTLIYNVPSQVSAAIDVLFTPIVDGYLCLFYSTGAAYGFTGGDSLKDFYTKTEIADLNNKQIFRNDRVALNIGLSDAKRIYDMTDAALTQLRGWSLVGTLGRFGVSSSPSTANYGLQYLAVQGGKTYMFKAVSKTCLSGYANVGFSRNMAVENEYVETVLFKYNTATETFDFLYTPVADGYMYLGYFNGETAIWSVKLVGNTFAIPGLDDVKNDVLTLNAMIKKVPIPFSLVGYGRIGSTYYRGNLGTKYAMSEIIPIDKYKTLIVRAKGNGSISCICFFDANQQQLVDLAVVGTTSLVTYTINLTDEQYTNVKYVQVGGYDAGSDFSDMYARLQPDYDLDTIRLVKYKKILCIGDSLTNSVQYSGQKRWAQYVQELLSIGARATSGTSGANMSNNGDDSIYATIQASTADADVDIVTLWGGTNDWGSNITLGEFETQIVDGTRDTTTFYGGLIANVLKLISLYPAKRIILIGTTPRTWNSGASDYNNTPNAGGKYLRDYVDAVKKVAEWFGLPFLDLLRTSGINTHNISQYMYQQTSGGASYYLHFNDNGEKQMGNRIASFIDSIG